MAPKGPKKGGPPASSDDDKRIWARVTGTVTPPTRRKAARVTPGAVLPDPEALSAAASPARGVAGKKRNAPDQTPTFEALGIVAPERPAPTRARPTPEELEPRRQRRLSRERDPIEARIDLHGFGRFEAEDQLRGFLMGCQARGLRSVLVITGQGRRGGGVIRGSVHDWLTGPHLRGVVSGFASAHRRHGGDGALYVTLKPR
ncbi:Smr/MutS family protein [Brevundimonas sp. NPDC090276]|uniref:Smr/MutS family protein n=1 Tax=Brevundimonas sp. NPDC090276 TaxID=3363956 RepID=UPI00383B7D86